MMKNPKNQKNIPQYVKHKDYKGVEEKILDLESQETVEYGLIDLDT